VNRRQAFTAGAVGLGAAALGAVLGWRVWNGPGDQPPMEFWNQRFQRPDGGVVATADLRAGPWVLNFWATWCAPCVRELPEIDRFANDFQPKGWQALALAIDSPDAVRAFLGKLALRLPVAIGGQEGLEWLRILGNSQAALPFTVVFMAGGKIRFRKLGQTSYAELAKIAESI
jgi:thiol-disulfide isomerase/thioredoxin